MYISILYYGMYYLYDYVNDTSLTINNILSFMRVFIKIYNVIQTSCNDVKCFENISLVIILIEITNQGSKIGKIYCII